VDPVADDRDGWELAEGAALTPELTVVSKLGGGSAYEAYLAFDEITYTAVVVKVVRPAQVTDEVTLRGLRREIETLEQVDHPALVRSLRSAADGERPHLVLEHLDGPRLSTLVRRHGVLAPNQYLPLGIEVASALHYMHGRGFLHLDVKPSNIIMGAPAKLIDVSVARSVDRAAALTHPVGTDASIAPEQCDPPRTGRPVPASDVWGLGATLYEAVAGDRAFAEGDADAEAVEARWPQLVDEPYAMPAFVPVQVAEVVMAMLDRAPGRRPTPSDVADAFAPLLGSLPQGKLSGIAGALGRRS
jgi:eukaryotic-like serine/threonine-protein kinase